MPIIKGNLSETNGAASSIANTGETAATLNNVSAAGGTNVAVNADLTNTYSSACGAFEGYSGIVVRDTNVLKGFGVSLDLLDKGAGTANSGR